MTAKLATFLRGCLKHHAKPELMNLEKSAWQESVKENYIFDYSQWRQDIDSEDSTKEISKKAMELRQRQK